MWLGELLCFPSKFVRLLILIRCYVVQTGFGSVFRYRKTLDLDLLLVDLELLLVTVLQKSVNVTVTHLRPLLSLHSNWKIAIKMLKLNRGLGNETWTNHYGDPGCRAVSGFDRGR
jgi:hypothetical protein